MKTNTKSSSADIMVVRRVKITGFHGRWTAEVEGRRLAVLHNTWWQPPHYYKDPMAGAKPDSKKFQAYLVALEENNLVVMQRDASGRLDRDGYIGVFYFTNHFVGDDGSVSLHVAGRYADPR